MLNHHHLPHPPFFSRTLVLRAIVALVTVAAQWPAGLLLPQPASAAAPTRATGRAEYAAQTALPDWFLAAPDSNHLAASADDGESVANPADASMLPDAATTTLPAWFTPVTDGLPWGAPDQLDPVTSVGDEAGHHDAGHHDAGHHDAGHHDAGHYDAGHHTIYPNQITVTVSPDTINQCDPLAVSVLAVNDAVTTTGVSVVVAAPPGLSPSPQVFNIPSVAPSATLSLTAVFSSGCSVVSGQIVVTLTQDSYPPIVKFAEYVVNPGAITVLKDPAVTQAALGDIVTWTVYVNNTGYGAVYNVQVTDTLGAGLQWMGGLTSTSFVSIPVGESRSFTISAQVMSCAGLDNFAVATWGCDSQTCQAPQQAKASIDLMPRFPALSYALPAFDLPYCAGFEVFAIPITNTGDGAAISPTLEASFAPFQVSVAAPASYSGGAFQLPDIPPGQTYTLVFTLTAPANICAAARQGEFNFDLRYQDACAFPYAEIPQMSSWQMTNALGELSVSKTMPPAIYRGQVITSIVTVNANGIVGSIVVTDQAPAGLVVLDPAGGVTFTQGANTFITWTLSGSAVLTPVFAVVDAPQGCALCGLPVTNIITATASDCQDCLQTATAQATTQIQCDEPEARGSKSVSGPAEVCAASALTFTNVYTFGSAFVVTPTWSSLIFTESLAYQTYTPGSATVWVGNGPVSCTATFSESVVGGALVISNITPSCNPDIAGATLIITYTTNVSETSACQDFTWYDWSYLHLGVTGNSFCAADGVLEHGVLVETQAPRMALTASGLPPNVASCGVYTLTLTAQRVSSVGAYDAVIDVPTATYAVLDVLGFGGAQPVFTQTDALGYHWFYADAFTSAMTATVLMRVQLRCASGPAPFQAAAHYDSLCADDDDYRQSCSAGGTLAAPPAYGPLSFLTKFPEIIYAQGDLVTWTLIAKNTGAGPAHSVALTDQLGSGLQFVTATITSSFGATGGMSMITSTQMVTWLVPVMQPKETLTIRYTAEIIGCTDLTNRLSQTQGCLGETCQARGPVTSVVELPPTILLNTNQTLSPIDTCLTRTVTVTVRNAGLLSVYDAVLTETLPVGLSYVMGSSEISTDTAQWHAGPDPIISGQSLQWSAASGAPLDALLPRVWPQETVYIRFVVRATCAFDGGQLRVQTAYRDTCGNPYLADSSFFLMTARRADISIDKIGWNLSRTSPSNTYLYAEPGETLVFTITVANAATAAPAQLLVVTDMLPANLILITATPGFTGALPGDLGGVLTWSIPLLNPNQTVALTLTAVVSAPNGCAITDAINTAQVSWGCLDGCRQSLPARTVRVRTRPVFGSPDIETSIAPGALNVCGGVITVTLNNDGPPAYDVALTNTLPAGYVFSGTILASTPPSSVVDLVGAVVYIWAILPSGLTTLTLETRNTTLSGACVVPSGAFSALLRYDDDIPDCPDTASYTTSASLALSILTPALTLDKAPLSQVSAAGQTVTWTVGLTNTGSGTAFNVVITDVAGSTFVSLTASAGGMVNGNVITWSLPSLAPGGVFTALVTAVLTSSGENRNVITATSVCGSGCLSGAAGDIAYVTLGDVFDKGPAFQTATVGSLTVFTFTFYSSDVENIFESVILTDSLPAGLGYVSAALTYTWDVDGNQGGPVTVFNVPPDNAPALYGSGNAVWNLGVLTGALDIDGVLTAVVQDVPAVFNGTLLTNTMRLSLLDDGQTSVVSDASPVAVYEPLLHLGKTAMTATGCSATLMEDHFNRASASPPAGWTAIAGAWNNANGVAQRSGGAAANAILARSGFAASELSYSALAWASDTTSSRGIVLRHTTNNYYLLRLRQSDGGTNLELQEVTAGTFAQLAVAPFAPIANRWYHLEAQVSEEAGGLRIRAYVDGRLYFDVVDSTPRSPGSVGFYTNNCAANACLFDDALVTRIHRAGCFVGAGDLLTFTLTISNQSRWPGFDLLVTDTLPSGLSLVTYTLTGNAPVASQALTQPAPIPGATGVLTWLIDHLTPTVPYSPLQHTALTLTLVTQVADWITANITLLNQAALSYDAWLSDTQPTTITRPYSGGSHAAGVQTVNPGIRKEEIFAPPPTATLGTLVTYTLLVPAAPITAVLYNTLVTDALDSRLFIESVVFSGGIGGSAGWSGQVVSATFAVISASTQALITVTARISHEFPSAAGDANAGDIITNAAAMSHSTAPLTASNQVSTVVGEPNLLARKSVVSSAGVVTALDGTAFLTYTILLTNTGSSPAYSVSVSDTLPAGISVTALFGGDDRSAPVSGPGVITWFVNTLSNAPPANTLALTYTARISAALVAQSLTNTVDVLYHSLTHTGGIDDIPGVRPYTATTTATVSVGAPSVSKVSIPPVLRVGDLVTYHLVFSVPAGLAAMGHPDSFLRDTLPPGVWYITDSETLSWMPAGVAVTISSRLSNTVEAPGSQVIYWRFAPITSAQDVPTVVTLTFRAQAVGLRIDTLAPLWTAGTLTRVVNTVSLWERSDLIDTDSADNDVIQPQVAIDKDSFPPPGSFVGAGDLITYVLTLSNTGHGPAYDIIISDALPPALTLITFTLSSAAPPTATFLFAPAPGAVGVLTWHLSALWGALWNSNQPGVAVITVVARVTDTIGANLTLTNTAAVPRYDSQPGDGPGPYDPDQREYVDGSDQTSHRTVDAGILKIATPLTVTLGDVITYVIVVPASPITATLYAVTVTDTLDAGHSPSRLQLAGVIDSPDGVVLTVGNAFTVTYPAIPAGEQRRITVTAVLSSPLGALAGQTITNVATLRHEEGGPTPSNETRIFVVEPALTLVKASDPPTSSTVGAGQTLTYTVSITNAAGPTVSAAYGLRFSDALPLPLRDTPPDVFSLTLDGNPIPPTSYTTTWDALSGALLITFSLDLALPPGSVLQIRYRVVVGDDAPAGVDVINQAAIRWSSLPPAGSDAIRDYGPITDTTNVHLGYPTLEIVKSVTPALAQAGDWLTYTLSVTAGGLVSATGVLVTDALPLNTAYVACSPTPCGVSGAVVSWTLGVLNIGESRQVTLVVAVNSPLLNGTLLTNTAHVTSSEGITDTDLVTTPVGSLPQLRLAKFSVDLNGPPLRPGDALSYLLVVVNLGNATANSVAISDVVPTNTTYVPGSIAGGDSASDAVLPALAWGINTLPPNTPITLSFAVTVNLPLTNGLALMNTASVTSAETPTPTSAIVTNTLVSDHTLVVYKTALPSPVEASAWLTYTIVYTLTGDEPVEGIAISDTTPVHTTFVSASPAPSSDPGVGNAGTVAWQFGPPPVLPPGSGLTQVTGVLTLVLQVDRPLISGTQIVNTVLLSDTSGLTDTHTVTTPVNSSHALDLSKHVEPAGAAQAGSLLTYTLRYTVTGNQPATGVLLTDTLPPSVTLQSCAPACVVSGQTLTWSLGALNPITTSALQVVARVDSNAPSGTLLLNLATIGDSSGLTDTDQVTTPVVVEAQIRLSKSVTPAVAAPGGLLTYTLLVTNAGPSDAQNVVVTDTLPALLGFVGAEPPPAAVSGGFGSSTHITWTLGALSAGASVMLTVTAQVSALASAGAILTNTATVTTSTPGDDPLDNTSTVTTPVTATAELVLRKHNSAQVGASALVAPSAPVTYTLVVTNLGPHPAWNVIVTDTLPVGIVYQSATPTPAYMAGSLLVWLLGILAPGQSVSITVRVTVSPAVALNDPLTNTAVTTTDTPGDDPSNNADDSPVTPVGPSVAIQKTLVGADLDDVAPNSVTFTIRITNTGPSAIARLPVEDEFDADLLDYTLAVPAPDSASPGLLVWNDLTAPAPHGFGGPLAPGHSALITVTFRVISDIVRTVNVARVREGSSDVYDNPTNIPEDDAEVINVPTAVTLRLFAVAGVTDRDVRLIWETETEQNNFQFNVYRSSVNELAQAALVRSVPAAMSGAQGASYVVTDTVPGPGVWWYWLADVDTRGHETVHQPPAQARVGVAPYRVWLPVLRAK